MQSTKLTTIVEALNEATMEEWQRLHRDGFRLDENGFRGDSDIALLGLEDIEDELTMEDARVLHLKARAGLDKATHAMVIPLSSATPDEARRARENDIDDMTHAEWNDET